MKWRNEQIYHLRQDKPLTKETQDRYFGDIIPQLFCQEKPSHLLFSFLKHGKLIGYGGLVHINWGNKNAEISFIMDTELEKEEFEWNWSKFLSLIEELAFEQMAFVKLYVYAFDLRPHLYTTLQKNNYFLDARLKKHCLINGELKDVVIHSKLNE
jgi:RimJ/RimL family protein N-acetyltransferase